MFRDSADIFLARALRAGSREVELDYPLAFTEAVRSSITNEKQCFRYMHVSGVLAERNQEKPLWFLQEGRRVKVRRLLQHQITWRIRVGSFY